MKSMSFCHVFVALGMLAAMPQLAVAGPRATAAIPLPSVNETTIAPMTTAFAEMPAACRKAVQESLRRYGLYRGAADGQWTAELGRGLIAYVQATGNTAHSWTSVAGSKGILWHASGDAERCPTPPFGS